MVKEILISHYKNAVSMLALRNLLIVVSFMFAIVGVTFAMTEYPAVASQAYLTDTQQSSGSMTLDKKYIRQDPYVAYYEGILLFGRGIPAPSFEEHSLTETYYGIETGEQDFANWVIPWYPHLEEIIHVVCQEDMEELVRPYSMTCWFACAWNLETADLSGLDGINVNDMRETFYYCTSLKNVTFGSSFTIPKVDSMLNMFWNCGNLISVVFPDTLNTGNLANVTSMFSGCSSLMKVDLGQGFIGDNIISMNEMFARCESLTSLSLPDCFRTRKATTARGMFKYCSSLTVLDLGAGLDTSSVTDFANMFSSCSSLTTLDLSRCTFNTSSAVLMQEMFSRCSSLTSLVFGGQFNTANATNMTEMFSWLSALPSLVLPSGFDTSNVVTMQRMFYACTTMTHLDLGTKFETAQVETMKGMFGSNLLLELDCSNWDVSSVTVHTDFNTKAPRVIPPVWVS